VGDLFLLVIAGHLLGDFVAQTDWQASNKEFVWRADLAHVFTYHLTLGALILPVWHDWSAAWVPGDLRWHPGSRRVADPAPARHHWQQELRRDDLGSDRDRPGSPPQHSGDQPLLVVTMIYRASRAQREAGQRHFGEGVAEDVMEDERNTSAGVIDSSMTARCRCWSDGVGQVKPGNRRRAGRGPRYGQEALGHILDKLGAANRTQAVARARVVGLLR
jgi:hypothetical protein